MHRRETSRGGIVANQSGNVAMMFGLFIIPMLVGAGIGIDMFRAHQHRSSLTEAADAGLLAAARARTIDGDLTLAAAKEIARRYFDANGGAAAGVSIDDFQFYIDDATNTYRLAIDGSVETTLLKITGRDSMALDINSEAKIAPPRALEVVMVLDNTYSMTGAKLADLKTSATNLVNTLMTDGGTNVKIGLVPFSQYVNVGVSNRDEPWISVPADYSVVNANVCRDTYPDKVTSNCVTTDNTCYRDGVAYTCSSTDCDVDWGDPVEVCEDQTDTFTFRGCVGSRNDPLDAEDADYATDPVPGLMNAWCTREITPLTDTKATILNEINAMSVQGSHTYVPTGLLWGYRTISSIAPYADGMDYATMNDDGGVKALILMTDGENTRSASYPQHNGGSSSVANDKLLDICSEVKSGGIQLFTISFDVTDTDLQTLMLDCASSAGHNFNASDGAQLSAAFGAIGSSLYELALTK
ncbi:MAG: VWA domain-containing protein [Pseudomonadota bacterium]